MRPVEFLGSMMAFGFFLVSLLYSRKQHEQEQLESLEEVLWNLFDLLKGRFPAGFLGFFPFYVIKVGSFLIACGLIYISFFVL